MGIKLHSELDGRLAIAGRLQPRSRVELRRVARRAQIFPPSKSSPMTPVPDAGPRVCHDGVAGAVAPERVALHVLVDAHARRPVLRGNGRSGQRSCGAPSTNAFRPALVKPKTHPAHRAPARSWKVGILGEVDFPTSVAQPELDEPFRGAEYCRGRCARPLASAPTDA